MKKEEDKQFQVKLIAENEKKKNFLQNCDNIINEYKKNNSEILKKSIEIKKKLDFCSVKKNMIKLEIEKIKQKNIFLENMTDYEKVQQQLENLIDIEKKNKMKLNMYKSGIKENRKKLEILNMKEQKLFFIAIFEFGIIIIFISIFFIYCCCYKKLNHHNTREEFISLKQEDKNIPN